MLDRFQLARYIDHTLLKPDADKESIVSLCNDALKYNFASVCVQPYYVHLASEILKNSDLVKVCTVVDFPFGYSSTFSKIESIKKSIDLGADELDVVTNVLAIKNNDWKTIRYELESISQIIKINDKLIKLIFETCYLTSEEIEKLSLFCVENDIHYLKTSTGYGTYGAKVEDVRLMHKMAAGKSKVKASGGIKTLDNAMVMIEAGAERIGTSSGVAIIEALGKDL